MRQKVSTTDIFVHLSGILVVRHIHTRRQTAVGLRQEINEYVDMLNMVYHVQKTRIFTSKIHAVQHHKFLSKAHMKQVFLKGLASASVRSTCSNAQVVVQDLPKERVSLF